MSDVLVSIGLPIGRRTRAGRRGGSGGTESTDALLAEAIGNINACNDMEAARSKIADRLQGTARQHYPPSPAMLDNNIVSGSTSPAVPPMHRPIVDQQIQPQPAHAATPAVTTGSVECTPSTGVWYTQNIPAPPLLSSTATVSSGPPAAGTAQQLCPSYSTRVTHAGLRHWEEAHRQARAPVHSPPPRKAAAVDRKRKQGSGDKSGTGSCAAAAAVIDAAAVDGSAAVTGAAVVADTFDSLSTTSLPPFGNETISEVPAAPRPRVVEPEGRAPKQPRPSWEIVELEEDVEVAKHDEYWGISDKTKLCDVLAALEARASLGRATRSRVPPTATVTKVPPASATASTALGSPSQAIAGSKKLASGFYGERHRGQSAVAAPLRPP